MDKTSNLIHGQPQQPQQPQQPLSLPPTAPAPLAARTHSNTVKLFESSGLPASYTPEWPVSFTPSTFSFDYSLSSTSSTVTFNATSTRLNSGWYNAYCVFPDTPFTYTPLPSTCVSDFAPLNIPTTWGTTGIYTKPSFDFSSKIVKVAKNNIHTSGSYTVPYTDVKLRDLQPIYFEDYAFKTPQISFGTDWDCEFKLIDITQYLDRLDNAREKSDITAAELDFSAKSPCGKLVCSCGQVVADLPAGSGMADAVEDRACWLYLSRTCRG